MAPALFAPLLDALDPAFETIVVRYPDAPAGYTVHERVAVAQLPADRPYAVLGESFSGPIAVMLVASRPRFLTGAILCATFLTCPRTLLRLAPAPVRRLSVSLARTALAARFLTARCPPLLKARGTYLASMQAMSTETLSARLAAIATVDVRQAAARISVPCLYLRASGDLLVPRAAGDECLRALARARLEQVEGPHLILQARARQAAKLIEQFVLGLDTGAAS